MRSNTLRRFAWYAFDMGNSAHALLVSTVGFAVYFRQELFATAQNPDALWGILTAVVLAISALVSPALASWCSHNKRRGIGLIAVTLTSVLATSLLGVWGHPILTTSIYIISAIGYYIALPLYNSLLPDITDSMEKTSARGWALGYLGGIGVLGVAFLFGALGSNIEYLSLFMVAAVYNLAFSIPLFWSSIQIDREAEELPERLWEWSDIVKTFRREEKTIRLLFSYWMVGEAATVVLYFTAIYLSRFAGLETQFILLLTVAAQAIALPSTWSAGELANWVSAKVVYIFVAFIWAVVPFLLWIVKFGYSYWYAIVGIGLVLGAYHSIVRAEVGRIADSADLDASARGSLWGFLEVTGRISQVLGPLIVGAVAFFVELPNALLFASVFPLIGIVVIKDYSFYEE